MKRLNSLSDAYSSARMFGSFAQSSAVFWLFEAYVLSETYLCDFTLIWPIFRL